MDLATDIYHVTRCFPKEEMFGLTSQLRRASVSVASNIAEGQGRATVGEFIQFIGMARGSTLEVQTQLELALRLEMGIEHEVESTPTKAAELLLILNAILKTTRARFASRSKRPN